MWGVGQSPTVLIYETTMWDFCKSLGLSVYMGVYNNICTHSPILTKSALSIFFITVESKCPIFSLSLFLSIVLICSSKTTESLTSGYLQLSISICVGSFALLIWDVMAAQITVGLYLFPTSFLIIKKGLITPCSEPTTGLNYISPFNGHIFHSP